MKGRKKDPKVQERLQRCKELGISMSAYYSRKFHGWTEEEALGIARVGAVYRTADGTPIFTYLKNIGKNYGDFCRLVNQGWSVEEALDKVVNQKGRGKYFIDGMSLRQWCIKNNKSYIKEYYKIVGRKRWSRYSNY